MSIEKTVISRIGDEVEFYCGRCRLDRTHRVVAQDPDGTIRKVICAMCNTYRAYRPPKESTARSNKPRAARTTTASAPRIEDFGIPSRTYNIKDNYQIGEVLQHTSFGVGKVVAIRDINKIEVKFSDGVKVLLQNK
jgi:hypothetical protein